MKQQLAAQAMVIPTTRETHCIVLGAGSIVEVLETGVSPVGLDNEIFIEHLGYANVTTNRADLARGWLAAGTRLETPRKKALKTELPRHDERASPVDAIRERAFKSSWKVARLCRKFGKHFQDELQAAIRELGGRPLNSQDTAGIIDRALQLLKAQEGTEMETKTETSTKARSSAKKTIGKKNDDAPARSMKRTVGNALAGLGIKNPTVTALQSDKDVKKTQLIALRDTINEAADAFRAKDQGSKAAKLSAANRLVRRLARQA